MGKILITGGAGFVGGHLVERLLATGHHVHIVDDLSSSPIPFERLLDELGHPANLTWSLVPLRTFYSPEGWDGIYHLASRVGPAGILQYAGEMIRSMVDDTYHVMAFALRSNCRLLFVSTSEIYNSATGYCTETTPATVPTEVNARIEYAVGKLASEIAVINTCKVKGLDAVLIRPFNISGMRQSGKGGFVLARFISQILAGKPLTVFGDGSQMRAFTDVRDVANALVLAFEKGKAGEMYNVGNPHNLTSILDLAYKVLREGEFATGMPNQGLQFTSGKAIFGELWEDARDKWTFAEKARDALGWYPTRVMDETIRDALRYEMVCQERQRAAVK